MRKFYSKLLKDRRSQRTFSSSSISNEDFDYILNCIAESPSSCNRQATSFCLVKDRNKKELLGGLLVGGVGWCHRADTIILLFAQDIAYKENLEFMKFIDAGIIAFNAYLACETLRIGCCFINPNVRTENMGIFNTIFPNQGTFCGALAIGHYDKKANYSPKVSYKDLIK